MPPLPSSGLYAGVRTISSTLEAAAPVLTSFLQVPFLQMHSDMRFKLVSASTLVPCALVCGCSCMQTYLAAFMVQRARRTLKQ
jgi:hypothetical protein